MEWQWVGWRQQRTAITQSLLIWSSEGMARYSFYIITQWGRVRVLYLPIVMNCSLSKCRSNWMSPTFRNNTLNSMRRCRHLRQWCRSKSWIVRKCERKGDGWEHAKLHCRLWLICNGEARVWPRLLLRGYKLIVIVVQNFPGYSLWLNDMFPFSDKWVCWPTKHVCIKALTVLNSKSKCMHLLFNHMTIF